MSVRLVLLSLALIVCAALCGCDYSPSVTAPVAVAVDTVQEVGEESITEPVAAVREETAQVAVAAVVAAQEAVQAVLPTPPSPAAPHLPQAATALIVRWEVSSPAYYASRLNRPIWPGGASGVTIGIGYDLGQQTGNVIARDWARHPQAARLPPAAGISGGAAAPIARAMRDVITPFPLAEQVFSESTLPSYHAAAARALGDGFHALTDNPQGALDSLGYNRGWSMLGPNRREMREIRDTCVPAGDAGCIAAQLRSMKRLWPTVRGLRDRREDEARVAETPS